MNLPTMAAKKNVPDVKRQWLLESAMTTFLRFGFRKTSMDEIARAAHVSRQGLYLHFPTKEELFSAAATAWIDTSFESASAAIADATSLEDKLVGAFNQWFGRVAGMLPSNAADMREVGEHLLGDLVREREEAFVTLIAKAVRAAKTDGISARDIAETLDATANGLKHLTQTPEEFSRRFRIAVKAVIR